MKPATNRAYAAETGNKKRAARYSNTGTAQGRNREPTCSSLILKDKGENVK